MEFEDYLLAPRIPVDNDPLEWWKANQTQFPTLFPMAKSFLGCPATTAELERVFSKAGKLHDDSASPCWMCLRQVRAWSL